MAGQTEFRSALLNPDAPAPECLTDGAGRPAGRRFDVYRNNVAVSLADALETAFPVVRKLVGHSNFRMLAQVFLRTHPPRSPVMMFYGAEMPEFLRTFGPTSSIGYLPDVAKLELAIRESYHAADCVPIQPEALQILSPDALLTTRLSLAPSLRLIRSIWPVHAIWRFNTLEAADKPEMRAEDIAVLRKEFDPEPVLLPPCGGAFLASLIAGHTLGAAIEDASAEIDFDLSACLALLFQHGAISSQGT